MTPAARGREGKGFPLRIDGSDLRLSNRDDRHSTDSIEGGPDVSNGRQVAGKPGLPAAQAGREYAVRVRMRRCDFVLSKYLLPRQ